MRTVIISSNDNPDYSFYIPLTTWAWNKLGWDVCLLKPFELKPYREETITQCIRLYASILKRFNKEDLLMTSDVDMIPLSNYWNPDVEDITVYGRDLTDYHYPICYIAMTKDNWGKVMHLDSSDIKKLIDRDLKESKALSSYKTDWWQVDQDIITDRLNKFTLKRVDRGIEPNTHYPLGRVDRGNNMRIPNTLIDFHAPKKGWQDAEKIKEVLTLAFNDCPEWFDEHVKKYNEREI